MSLVYSKQATFSGERRIVARLPSGHAKANAASAAKARARAQAQAAQPCPHCGGSKAAKSQACQACHQRLHPPAPKARPVHRQRWEIDADALAAHIRAEPDGARKQELRLQLLRVRYTPWAKRKEAA